MEPHSSSQFLPFADAWTTEWRDTCSKGDVCFFVMKQGLLGKKEALSIGLDISHVYVSLLLANICIPVLLLGLCLLRVSSHVCKYVSEKMKSLQ